MSDKDFQPGWWRDKGYSQWVWQFEDGVPYEYEMWVEGRFTAVLCTPDADIYARRAGPNPNAAREALLRFVSGWDWLPAQVREALETEIPSE